MDKVLKNVILFASGIILVAVIALVLVLNQDSGSSNQSNQNLNNQNLDNSNTNSNTATVVMGDVQNVKLTVSKGTYILTPSVLKKDIPVRMEVDLNTVKGCARAIIIPEFNVKKYVAAGDNIITFTPTKSGEIEIACTMYMYTGTFTVE